jgi:predicted transposase/invertase (TIGR01784 family)
MLTIAESLREEGKIEGEREGIQKIAKLMLAKKQPLEKLMEFTGLTMAEIEALDSKGGD